MGDDFSIEQFASEDSSKRRQFDKEPIRKPDTIYTVSNLETYGYSSEEKAPRTHLSILSWK